MNDKLNDKEARCPFLIAHTGTWVVCEGVIPDSTARITFQQKKAKELQYEVYCCGRYDYCEMYQAVRAKYEEE